MDRETGGFTDRECSIERMQHWTDVATDRWVLNVHAHTYDVGETFH